MCDKGYGSDDVSGVVRSQAEPENEAQGVETSLCPSHIGVL